MLHYQLEFYSIIPNTYVNVINAETRLYKKHRPIDSNTNETNCK